MRDVMTPMTPKEFKEKMLEFSRYVNNTNDQERGESLAKDIVVDLLNSLGYSEGAEVFSCLGYYI